MSGRGRRTTLGLTATQGVGQQRYTADLAAASNGMGWVYDPDLAIQSDPDPYATLMQDGTCRAGITRRVRAVASPVLRVDPKSDEEQDKHSAAALEALLTRGNHRQGRRWLAAAVVQGVAVVSVDWQRERLDIGDLGERVWWVPKRIRSVGKQRLRRRKSDGAWELYSPTRRAWEVLSDAMKRRMVIWRYEDSEDTLGFGRGIGAALYVLCYDKMNLKRYGLEAAELWARGGILAKKIDTLRLSGDGDDNQTVVDNELEALRIMRGDNAVVYNKDEELSLLASTGAGEDRAKALMEYIDGEISLLTVGSRKGLGERAGSGGLASGAAAVVDEEKLDAIASGDRAELAEVLDTQLAARCWRLNKPLFDEIGGARGTVNLTAGHKATPREEAEMLEIATRTGVPVTVREALERTGYRAAEEDDEILAAPQAAAGGFGGFGLDDAGGA